MTTAIFNEELKKALDEFAVPDDASPDEKLRAVCQWVLGDPQWAQKFIAWMDECGFNVSYATGERPKTRSEDA